MIFPIFLLYLIVLQETKLLKNLCLVLVISSQINRLGYFYYRDGSFQKTRKVIVSILRLNEKTAFEKGK